MSSPPSDTPPLQELPFTCRGVGARGGEDTLQCAAAAGEGAWRESGGCAPAVAALWHRDSVRRVPRGGPATCASEGGGWGGRHGRGGTGTCGARSESTALWLRRCHGNRGAGSGGLRPRRQASRRDAAVLVFPRVCVEKMQACATRGGVGWPSVATRGRVSERPRMVLCLPEVARREPRPPGPPPTRKRKHSVCPFPTALPNSAAAIAAATMPKGKKQNQQQPLQEQPALCERDKSGDQEDERPIGEVQGVHTPVRGPGARRGASAGEEVPTEGGRAQAWRWGGGVEVVEGGGLLVVRLLDPLSLSLAPNPFWRRHGRWRRLNIWLSRP